MSRFLACCLVCLASPALAEVITVRDGDSYDRLNIVPGRELVMDGGRVGLVNNFGGLSTINDGLVGSIESRGTKVDEQTVPSKLVVNGFDNPATDQLHVMMRGDTSTEIHGYNFRVSGYGMDSGSSFQIKGWMLDGRFVEFTLGRTGFAGHQQATLVTHEPKFVDPDGDWDFDLTDLNTIRNNFGLRQSDQKSGDTNFDGVVDLEDLNVVRDHFGGYDQQGWPVEWEFSGDLPLGIIGEFPAPIAVPEPSSFITAAVLGLGVLVGILAPRRCR